ncbi:thiopeptide-type bacteriocin biosynthesis protein [Streptomyces sp. P38-E01]|uniref:Thiopeptide-type bacteriocin biosynthesis protein n=1 Tax=Streptomyces tardus TaxID=2780544 RepID=A0A949N9D3_9ACTN|nr:thiopeptide-type bacteriocin biosynthesis protein [Streptomyces tardus]MBU7598803.1 thiopeptide-type bacteriocin biosynthesis protein [Streptomyces tardus]
MEHTSRPTADEETVPGTAFAGPVNKEPDAHWHAWHLHLDTDERSARDRVVTEVVAPAVASVPGRPWFFIRYWHGGPHVRLRLRDLAEDEADRVEKVLTEALATAGEPRGEEERLRPEEYESAAARLAAVGDRPTHDEVSGLLPPGAHRFAYHPEYERYGGRELMPATERLFQLSSQLCLAFLRREPSSGARAMLALRATRAAGQALGEDDEAVFYALGLHSWRAWAAGLGYSDQQLDRLSLATVPATALPEDPGPLGPWRDALRELAADVREHTELHAGQVVSSHVHMLHNRLALHVTEEIQTYARLSNLFPGPAIPDIPQGKAHPLHKEQQ